MKITKSFFVLIIALIAMTSGSKVFSSTEIISVLVGDEEYVIITEKGKLRGPPVILQPGEYKINPDVSSVHRYSKGVLELEGNSEAMSEDKLIVMVDTKVKWRIIDPLEFFSVFMIEQRLNDNLNAATTHIVRGFVNDHSSCELFQINHQENEVTLRHEVNNKFVASYLEKAKSMFSDKGVEISSIRFNGTLKDLHKQRVLQKCKK